MDAYDFQMASDESHALVLIDGKVIGTIQNNPAYLGGGLNFAQNSVEHGNPLRKVDDGMWDQFYDWADGKVPVAAGSAA